MSLNREAGSTPVTHFTVPYKGTWNSIAANMLSPDSLYYSMNVYIRKGKIRERPGLLQLNDTEFNGKILGAAMAVTPSDKIILAVSPIALYTLYESDTIFNIDTLDTFSIQNRPIDITFLETSNDYVAIIASEGVPMRRWIQGSGSSYLTTVVGTNHNAKSVCTSARRIVALIPPHTIRWTSTLTWDNWPELAFAKVAQTNDEGICVVSLGTLDFVIYKERSIYLAKAQAGSDASAFNIHFAQNVEGPAGVNAVVNIGGTHYYMTRNGRVGSFDGSSYVNWIADGLWLYLQDDIDSTHAGNIFGVFDYRLHTLTFYYPKVGDDGLMKGMLLINLPLEGSGIDEPAFFLGVSGKSCTYGCEMRFNNTIDRSLIFGETDEVNEPFLSDENTRNDDGVVFDCAIQTGLFPLPDIKYHHLSVESFVERSNGNGQVRVYSVVSDMLENETGVVLYDNGSVIDLNNNPVMEYIGFNTPTRFFGLRYEWSSVSKVRYAGTVLYGRMLV